jgi:hypothetical protein
MRTTEYHIFDFVCAYAVFHKELLDELDLPDNVSEY